MEDKKKVSSKKLFRVFQKLRKKKKKSVSGICVYDSCRGLREMCRPSDPRRRYLAGQPNAIKRHLIYMPTLVDVPEIKPIRTDTTLDLSQKAEKVCFKHEKKLV